MILNPEFITLKDKVFTVCENIVVILEEGGKWLDWLPVDHNIIFVSHNLAWVKKYSMISRLQKSLYYLVDAKGDANMYQRDTFLIGDLTKVICRGQVGICQNSELMRLPEKFVGLDFPAVAFEFSPYSHPDFENGHHEGFEYEIVAAITNALGLNLVVKPPSTGGMWGWEEDNGNFTGEIQ